MLDINTEAFVLDKEDLGEYDNRFFLYTKDLGKVIAKATSSRKIISKLASHLEPLSYTKVRLVSRKDYFTPGVLQLVDALLIGDAEDFKLNASQLRSRVAAFNFLKLAAPNGIPDLDLWSFLHGIHSRNDVLNVRDMLNFLGFNPSFAVCELCQKSRPEYFFTTSNFFVCRHCGLDPSVSDQELIAINK